MKKSLIALAALATAGFASAQSSVTVFGVVDTGFQRVEREAAGSDVTTNRLASGSNKTSRLGFRGTEDLGGGLKANFWLEMGVASDSGASASTTIFTNNQTGSNTGGGGLVFNRRATVGLSGGFGEVRLGRDSVVGLLTQESFDPFDANGVGSQRQVVYANVAAVSTAISSVRASNMINYFSPNIAGFTADVGYAFNENASNAGPTKKDGRLVTARLGYTLGKFNAKLGGTQIDYAAGDYQEYTVGASYDFGIVKPALAFHSNKIKGVNKTDVIMASLTAPVGPGLIRAAYTRADQKSGGNNDGNIFAIGYIYNLSKRTQLYTTYALSDNKNGSTLYQVGGSPGAAVANGRTTGLDLGVTHSF
jgi:predicted porin